jgi:hypothetical protein
VALVHRIEGDKDGRRSAEDEALPRLTRRERRREPVAADEPSREVGRDVAGENGEQNGEGRQPPVIRNGAQQDDEREAEPDPAGAEHGRGDRDGRALPRRGDPVQDERERNRREKAARHPVDAAELRTEQREHGTGVCRRHERAQ